jgi:hypothetical protein
MVLSIFCLHDLDDEERHLGCIGWIGWIYSAIYSPISQILCIAGNFHSASAELKAVQAFAIGTSMLSLTAGVVGSDGKLTLEWPSMPSRASASLFSVSCPVCYSYPLANRILTPKVLSLF